MNKHELKSLLENIYHLLAEYDVPPMLAPYDPNWSPLQPPPDELANPLDPGPPYDDEGELANPDDPGPPYDDPPIQLPPYINPIKGDDLQRIEDINRLLWILRQGGQLDPSFGQLDITNQTQLQEYIWRLLEELQRQRERRSPSV